MSDLEELAHAAAHGRPAPSGGVRIGSFLLPGDAVESIEPYSGSRTRPMGYLTIVLIVAAPILLLAGAASDDHHLARWTAELKNIETATIGAVALVVVGLIWLFAFQRRVYGWTIHCFYRPSITVKYDNHRAAERMLTYLRANLPHVPIVRKQEWFFWWISF